MPRRKTVQPAPLETHAISDDLVVEVRDVNTRLIGRGQDKKFESDELNSQVLLGLIDDLESGNPGRQNRAKNAFKSDTAMARHLLDGGYEMDDRTARRHGKKIREEYALLLRARSSG